MERASVHISQNVLGAAPFVSRDLTPVAWPTYQRTTLAVGGDATARFSYELDNHVEGEWWLEACLASHIEEVYGGVTTFSGIVHTIRVGSRGVLLSVSLEDLANHIVVVYRTGSGAGQATTAAVTDSASIARFGRRERRIDMGTSYINAATATQIATTELSFSAWPRVQTEETDRDVENMVEVEVMGYTETLNWRHINDTGSTMLNASDEVTDILSTITPDYVTAGEIETNTTQISREVDQKGGLDRLLDIVAAGGPAGRYNAGCFGGRQIEYTGAELNVIGMEIEARHNRLLDATGGNLAAPLVRPGVVAWVRDVFPGRPRASTLLEDPRASFITAVTYDAKGATLKRANNKENRRALVRLALERKR